MDLSGYALATLHQDGEFVLCRGRAVESPTPGQDRADVEHVFNRYLQSLEAADVALAAQVWWQSPDVLVVTPIGRFQGWEGVKEIWARTEREFQERKVEATAIDRSALPPL